jgi:hypothetical protein
MRPTQTEKETDMTIEPNRADEVRALVDPMIEECIARARNAGVQPHEIAQIMILNGAGLLSATLGPKHAGYDLRTVAESTAAWIGQIAAHYETKETH